MTELFLPRGSLVSDVPAGDGKLVNLFLQCIVVILYNEAINNFMMSPGDSVTELPRRQPSLLFDRTANRALALDTPIVAFRRFLL